MKIEMKINKSKTSITHGLTTLGFIFGLVAFAPHSFAADPLPAPMPLPTVAASNPTSSTPPSIDLPATSNAAPGDATADSKDSDASDKKNSKNLKSLENKVADQAKDIVKRLGTAPGDLTLDDLNAAKITVAKIDAMIEIEKHLADLDKVREERSKIGSSSMSSVSSIPQIPATAFQTPSLPLSPMPQHQMASEDAMPMMQPVSSMEVARIIGADGHYSAVLSMFGGQTKVVHVGDKLPDGSIVTGISPKGVDLKSASKSQVLLVKGVDKVYGRSL